MKKLFLLFFLISCITFAKPQFYFKYANFQKPNGNLDSTQTRIYLSLLTNSLKYINKNNYYITNFTVHILIKDRDKTIISEKFKKYKKLKTFPETQKNSEMLMEYVYNLPPKSYSIQVIIEDHHNQEKGIIKIDQKSEKFLVKNFKKSNKENISDLILAFKIKKVKHTKAQFIHNDYLILPNPSSIISNNRNNVFFYIEAYNLKNNQNYTYNLLLLHNKKEIYKSEANKLTVQNKKAFIYNNINMKNYQRGKYSLEIEIKNNQNLNIKGKTDLYIIHQADYTKNLASERVTEILENMSQEQVDLEFDKLNEAILKYEDNSISKYLNADGRLNFLKDYWTNPKHNRANFLSRIDIAEKKFTNLNIPGWQTDRGSIFIRFGKPDALEKVQQSTKICSHEIWDYYNLGIKFIFADKYGSGNYKLIHSTHEDYYSNEQWEYTVKK